MILAIALSALVIFGWSMLAERYFPQPKPAANVSAAGKPAANAAPGAPAGPAAPVLQSAEKVISTGSRVKIDTPRIAGSLNLTGAVIDDLVLKDHREGLSKSTPPVRLLSPAGARNSYFAGFGWTGAGLAVPGPATQWTADRATLTPETPVTLSWDNGQGQLFAMRIAVDKDYMFTVQQTVTNRGAGAVGVRSYGYTNRVKGAHSGGSMLAPTRDRDSWTLHVGPVGAFDGKMNYDVDYDDVAAAGANGVRFSSRGGWAGFGETYWLTALVPDQDKSADFGFRHGNGSYQAEFAMPQQLVAPGASISTTSRLFAGAKEVHALDRYEHAGVPLFGKAIDWGWFEVIEKPIFYLLDWLFKLVGNFGVAIIMLTVIVRGLMFPIAQRQFASMAAMRVVQPKMKALQERYKDDRVKMQQELAALYQKEKINPLAGCLPILIQIPIFYALYKVLLLAIEMRHQPFALWIKDLSAPDHLTPVNLFGLLDFTPPAMLAIGVLPILLGITMWLQFKLNPAPIDPVQQQVFSIMPWIMMFMMAPFAAGLQLYWTVSNLLTIAQQKWLYSKHPALKEPVKT